MNAGLLRRAAVLAAANVRGALRDRMTLGLFVALPLVIIVVVGIATGGATRAAVGLVVDDPGAATGDLVSRLERDPALRVVRYSSRPELERALRGRSVAAGVYVPEGHSARLAAGQAAEVEFLVDRGREYPVQARLAVDRDVGASPAPEQASSVKVFDIRSRQPVPIGFRYTAPANLVLFMFVNVLGGAAGMIASRARGCETRLFATSTPRWLIILGDGLGRFALGMLQALLIVVVGAVVFDVRWGAPLPVGLVIVAFAFLGAGATQLLGVVARSESQAKSIAAPAGILLGMLGGCMWPLAIVGPAMRRIGHAIPHSWAMDALLRLSGGAGTWTVLPQLALLSAVGAVAFWLAAARLGSRPA